MQATPFLQPAHPVTGMCEPAFLHSKHPTQRTFQLPNHPRPSIHCSAVVGRSVTPSHVLSSLL